MTTDPNDLDSRSQNGADHTGSAEIGLGTDPSGTDGTVDRVGDTGATSRDNADTPMGSLGGGLKGDDDR
ncbi:hypothetical protein DAETH_30540 [Deinococcus aetherius]|uniref:Uncharacterized protein n=1 Tax=Deinococcus aetherius TaxID=200252 RepID=A0ABM8AH02_9DEIO|nr:hypothetical protein [Deinococcus aetherius]BDP43085.1 hypothetical protein DAETH_30540 [Deinococcus aetherius]